MKCEKCGKEHDGSFGSGRFCSRKCANSRIRTLEIKEKISKGVKRSEKFKGHMISLYGHCDFDKKNFCPICGKQIKKDSNYCSKHKFSDEVKLKISQNLKGKTGGFRNYGGNGKSGIYKGFLCQSSWELAWLIYQLDHGVNVKRNKDYFEYEFEGKKHKYYPDFQIDNIYYEIKGKRYANFEAKIKQFPFDKKLILIEGIQEMMPFIRYCKQKYGDFCNLYDRRW
jgi:hypothetical protein